MERGSAAQQQQKATVKQRPREGHNDERSAAQPPATGAPCTSTKPPVGASRDHHAHEPSRESESAHSLCNQQQLPGSASAPCVKTQVSVPASLSRNGVEADDVEEQLMRALEDELEAPRAGPEATPARVFQDADEDDDYDESEDDDE